MSELWRRLPSPWLVLSIELAFAARRMHARTIAVSNASKCSFCLQSDFGLACRQLVGVEVALRRVFRNRSIGSRDRKRDRGTFRLAWSYCW